MRETPSKRLRTGRLPLLALALLWIVGAAADSLAGTDVTAPPAGSARLTAVAGSATVGDAPLSRTAGLADDSAIETGDDGNAAMLVDEDNLVELCASTKMKLKRHPSTGGRVIEVGAGTTRIIVDPTAGNEPLQISTPAAIATIMGTVVYVTVDPGTGETTITSGDHPVRIQSSDPKIGGSTTINGLEQITMRPGQAPATPKRVAPSVLENLSGCLQDIHGAALAFDRAAVAKQTQDRMAQADGEVAQLPVVGAGPPEPSLGSGNEQGIEDPADIIVTTDVVSPPQLDDDLDFPDPCGGIPGDGCFPFPNVEQQSGGFSGFSAGNVSIGVGGVSGSVNSVTGSISNDISRGTVSVGADGP